MGVKYVRDFEFPAAAGFRDSAMPAKARASERGMPAAAKRGVAKLKTGGPARGRGAAPAPGSLASLARNPNPNVASNAWAKGQKTMFPIYQRTGFPAGRSGTESNYQYDSAYDPAFEQGYREFEQSERGLAKGGKVRKVMREYKAGKLHSGKSGKVVKNPKQAMAIALSEARKSGEKVKKLARGGPTSREATGPTSGRATYIPNPFGKSIKVYTGPTGGNQPRVSTRNPRDIFGNENPDFNRAMREAEEARMREMRGDIQYAKGGKVSKFSKGGQMTAQDRRALEKMRHAEKYAPGLSLDMPGKRVKKK